MAWINHSSTSKEVNYLPFFWTIMTEEEKLKYCIDLRDRCLEHRYRYYELDDPVLEDFEYDHLEKTYKEVSREMNLKDESESWVDWNITLPGAPEAKIRVMLGVDHYTIHKNALEKVWKKIGPPRYIRKSEAK